MRVAAFAVALLAAGCGRGAPADPAAASARPPPPATPPADRWSRGAGDATGRPSAPRLGPVVPAALDELVDQAPRAPGAAPGPTRIGAPTHQPEADPGEAASAAATSAPKTTATPPKPPVPEMATPSVERECRAQLYWPLVDRCRDAGGAVLPPDVVTLRFLIDPDGAIVSSTIQATAADARWDAAAECMRRELSALPFRAPASVRGALTRVEATVPSVD